PQLSTTAQQKQVISSDSLLSEVVQVTPKRIDFQYFSTKARLFYKDNEKDETATVQLRIKKDSLIWLRIEKVGFEGLRVLVKTDSVFVWDAANNNLREFGIDSLNRQFHFRFSFQLLQNALLGNLPFASQESDKFFKTGNYYLLRQNEDRIKIENYVATKSLALQKLVATEENTKNQLTVDYENFETIDQVLFAMKHTFQINYAKQSKQTASIIILEHIKPDFSDKELNFPFNFQRYRRKDDKED
ncbi:MAG: DUF4292 domain-containing protein, partial [Verrucomicrobia bacterium]|nr:DUF4292 domain-containing protein [Cytophagales bacterium]